MPGLSAIPVLGELFKYKEHNIQKSSLMVFLTPTIVHSREDQERVLQHELDCREHSDRVTVDEILRHTLEQDSKRLVFRLLAEDVQRSLERDSRSKEDGERPKELCSFLNRGW